MPEHNATIKTGVLRRNYAIDVRSIDDDKRTVDLSFSSEEPYQRWFGVEILGHGQGEVDLSFIGSGRAPLLVGHRTDDIVGVIESASIGADRKGRAVARFGRSSRAEEIFADVKDGIRQNVSVGYQVKKMRLEEDDEETGPTYRAILWKPLEASIVAIPADESVGVGRTAPADQREFTTEIISRQADRPEDPSGAQGGRKMPETNTQETKTEPAVDVSKIESQTRTAEKARISEIIALGESHGLKTEAMQAVEDGTAVDVFRKFVLDHMAKKGLQTIEHGSDVGLTEKESRQFSFIRAINALANPSDRGAQEAAAFEFECSRAVSSRMKKGAQGIMVPFEVLRRDLVVGTDASGGYLVSTDLLAANFIDMLRNRMMTRALGALTLGGLVGDVAIPKQTGGATAYWVAESGAPTESTQVLAQLALTPKTCGAFTDLSRKFLLQSSIDAEAFVRADLAACLALALDAAGIAGTGSSNQPTGILSTTGIGDVACGDPDGAAPTWGDIVGLETEVAVDNADVGALAYLTNAKARGKLKQVEKATNTGLFVWENGIEAGFGLMNGYRAAASNQVPSDLTKGAGTALSAIIFGNWADLIYGLWGTVDITVDPYTNSTSGTVRVVALQDADVGVRHAESFAACQDAVTT
jgi:HK97 family phage major capsid protein/HK97 family phage prohead protease